MRASTSRTRFVVSAIVVLVTAHGLSGQQPPLLPPGASFQVLETYLESMRGQVGIPGMSAAVVFDESIIWEKGFGYQNLASRIPATPDTPYVVDNLTETVAAVLVLQCVGQRRLRLAEPIQRFRLSPPRSDATPRPLVRSRAPRRAAAPVT